MKCRECPDYAKCVKESNLAIKRKNCQKAKTEKVKTNADRIRAMSEHELAVFLSEKYAAESIYRVREQGHEPTATQIKALHEGLYMTWLRWLRQPAEVDHESS